MAKAIDPKQEQALVSQIENELNISVQTKRYADELSLIVDEAHLFPLLKYLKEKEGFNYLVDIVSVDHYQEGKRFEILYNIVNLEKNIRIRVKAMLEGEYPEVESVTSLWPSANWYEREVYDMMGIRFRNHPDLRRIYLPEDFEYYPLRKEFPQLGIPGSLPLPEKDPPKPYK